MIEHTEIDYCNSSFRFVFFYLLFLYFFWSLFATVFFIFISYALYRYIDFPPTNLKFTIASITMVPCPLYQCMHVCISLFEFDLAVIQIS